MKAHVERAALSQLSALRLRAVTLMLCAVVAMLGASCASAAALENVVPVEVVDSRLVHLWNVQTRSIRENRTVSGLAIRRLATHGPMNEHLHAEAMDVRGMVLQMEPVSLTAMLSERSETSVRFRVVLETGRVASIVRVRLSLAKGFIHREGEADGAS